MFSGPPSPLAPADAPTRRGSRISGTARIGDREFRGVMRILAQRCPPSIPIHPREAAADRKRARRAHANLRAVRTGGMNGAEP